MKFSAVCGVCNQRLEWEQSGDCSWGIINVGGQGCVEVTIQDPTGEVNKHLSEHHKDGSFVEAHKKLIKSQGERFNNMSERGVL